MVKARSYLALLGALWSAGTLQANAADEGTSNLPLGIVGVFSELRYGATDEGANIAFPDSSRSLTVKLGTISSFPEAGLVVIPSITLKGQSGTGANAFVPIDTSATIVGAGINAIYSPLRFLHLRAGGTIDIGWQEAVFNSADTSDTRLWNASVFGGVSVDVWRNQRAKLSISDQLAYSSSHADYAPTNSIDASDGHVLSNTLSVIGTYDLTDATRASVSAGLVSLLDSKVLAGEDPLDPNYGIVSLGLSHDVSEHLTIYGNASATVGNEAHQGFSGTLGVRKMF